MANPAHGLTTNRASPSTRQSTANTELTRNCGRLGAAAWLSSAWKLAGESAAAPTFLRLLAWARARQRAPWCAAAARQALNQRWKAQAAFAALRAHACSLLELPIAGPSDPSDDQEVPLGELLAGSLRPDPSRLA